ncbi:sulfatase [Lacibacter sp. H407]|uniref:sulfatase n=1 Tax=Lacibacter sp. H407 TaxID=3133423 RepID=UPI0030C59F44
MNNRWFLVAAISHVLNSYSVAQQKPNIIYIMTDDLGYADLSCYGRKDYQTPHLDKLAAQGMKFTQAYAAAPVCTPTRTAFMTGRYPARTSIGLLEPWVPSKRDNSIGLNAADHSVAALVKKAGYETALIGKWHLGVGPSFSPLDNGFDYFYGIYTGAADYISHKGDGEMHDLYENRTPVYTKGYATELLGSKTISFLQQKHNKPFFLSLQFTAPHWPWQGPNDPALPDTVKMSAKLMATMGTAEAYKAMMKSLDEQVGIIMKTLEETGLAANTIVIFTSDNGGEKFSDMGPLAKMKMTVWEGGVRVPAFVRWPGKIKANTVSHQQVITMDWTATILAAAGAKANEKYAPDGIDLLPVLTGKQQVLPRTFYWRITQRRNQHAILDHNWKYIVDETGEHLFDLSVDEGERNNLITTQQVKVEELKRKYKAWEQLVLTPLPLQ